MIYYVQHTHLTVKKLIEYLTLRLRKKMLFPVSFPGITIARFPTGIADCRNVRKSIRL